MGREVASALGRWSRPGEYPRPPGAGGRLRLAGEADWFRKVPTARTRDHADKLANGRSTPVYGAPRSAREVSPSDVLRAASRGEASSGSTRRRQTHPGEAEAAGQSALRSSPFLPAPSSRTRRSSGLCVRRSAPVPPLQRPDPQKPINWKRQVTHCGEIV